MFDIVFLITKCMFNNLSLALSTFATCFYDVKIQLTTSLPPGITAADACRTLKNKYHLNMQSLLQASPSVQHHWGQLQCSVLTPLTLGSNQDRDTTTSPIASHSANVDATVITKPQTSSSATTQAIRANNIIADSFVDGSSSNLRPVKSVSPDPNHNASPTSTTSADPALATSPAILESMVRARCKKLRDKHGVQPGKSWGTLPIGITYHATLNTTLTCPNLTVTLT